jgi:hypothetical protein
MLGPLSTPLDQEAALVAADWAASERASHVNVVVVTGSGGRSRADTCVAPLSATAGSVAALLHKW